MFNKWKKKYSELWDDVSNLLSLEITQHSPFNDKMPVEDMYRGLNYHDDLSDLDHNPYEMDMDRSIKRCLYIKELISKRPVKVSFAVSKKLLIDDGSIEAIKIVMEEASDTIQKLGNYVREKTEENETLKETLKQYDDECKKLKQENQELQEEVLRLRYFYQVHSEGDQ